MATAIFALVAIVCWLAFWTATDPIKWRGKEMEIIVAIASAALALLATATVVEQLARGWGFWMLWFGLVHTIARGMRAKTTQLRRKLDAARSEGW